MVEGVDQKKWVKAPRNPFELNLGKKLLKGGCKKRTRLHHFAKKSNKSSVKKVNDSIVVAEKIIDTALDLGLELPKGRDVSIQDMARVIEDGEI